MLKGKTKTQNRKRNSSEADSLNIYSVTVSKTEMQNTLWRYIPLLLGVGIVWGQNNFLKVQIHSLLDSSVVPDITSTDVSPDLISKACACVFEPTMTTSVMSWS